MIRRHQPDLPIDGESIADDQSMGVLIPFPGADASTGEIRWTNCEECGEELMEGDICVWCSGEAD